MAGEEALLDLPAYPGHEAFSAVVLAETEGHIITAIAFYENCIYYGTDKGELVRSIVLSSSEGGGDGFVAREVERLQLESRRRVDQIAVVLPLRMLLVLSGGSLTSRSLEDLKEDVSEVASDREGCKFALEEREGVASSAPVVLGAEGEVRDGGRAGGRGGRGVAGGIVRVAFASRRRVQLLEWSHAIRSFVAIKELAIPQAPLALSWAHGHLWLGYQREYNYVQVQVIARRDAESEVRVGDVETEPLLLRGAHPAILAHPDGLLLAAEHRLGMRVQRNGSTESAPTLAWSLFPSLLLWSPPFVLACSSSAAEVDIHWLSDAAPAQRLDLAQLTGAAEETESRGFALGVGKSRVDKGVVCGADGLASSLSRGRGKSPVFLAFTASKRRSFLVRLEQAPLEAQLERLLRVGDSQRAELMLETDALRSDARTLTARTLALQREHVMRRLAVTAARTHFLRLEFEQARAQCMRRPMPIDPLELAALFPALRGPGFSVQLRAISPALTRGIVEKVLSPAEAAFPRADAQAGETVGGMRAMDEIVHAIVERRKVFASLLAERHRADQRRPRSSTGSSSAVADALSDLALGQQLPPEAWEWGPLTERSPRKLIDDALECVCDILLTWRQRSDEQGDPMQESTPPTSPTPTTPSSSSTTTTSSSSSSSSSSSLAPLAATPSSPAPAAPSASTSVFDATFMRALALTGRVGMLDSFLTESNGVDPADADAFLSSRRLYHSLALLYKTRGELRKALSLWKRLGSGELREHGHDGVAPTVELLRSCNEQAVVLEYAGWVLVRDPELGMQIFTDSTRTVSLSPDAVFDFLRSPDITSALKTHPAVLQRPLTLRFLKHLVCDTKSTDPRFHTLLAKEYIAALNALPSSPSTSSTAPADLPAPKGPLDREDDAVSARAALARWDVNWELQGPLAAQPVAKREAGVRGELRRELLGHLETSTLYSDKELCETLATTQLVEEFVVVLGRAGHLRRAIWVLLHRLFDLRAAETFCVNAMRTSHLSMIRRRTSHDDRRRRGGGSADAGGGGEGVEEDADSSSLSLLAEALFTEEHPSLRVPFREFGLVILRAHPESISATKVLALLPKTMPLAELVGFLSHRLPAATDSRRAMHLRRTLQSARHVTVNAELSRRQRQYAVLRKDTKCAISGEIIGDSVFVVLPDNRIVLYKHYLAEE